jgi:hypothetical protein
VTVVSQRATNGPPRGSVWRALSHLAQAHALATDMT